MAATNPHTTLRSYGPGIFSPEELDEAPERSVVVTEEGEVWHKPVGRRVWYLLTSPVSHDEWDRGHITSAHLATSGMLILTVQEPGPISRAEAIRVLALRAIASHGEFLWEDHAELSLHDAMEITREVERLIKEMTGPLDKIREAERVIIEARARMATEEDVA